MADQAQSADPVLDPQNAPVIDTSPAQENPSQDTAPEVAPEAPQEVQEAAPTNPATTPADAPSEAAPASPQPAVKPVKGRGRVQTLVLPPDVPANVSLVEFPVDEFGITSELKEVFKAAAGRVNGAQDKYDVLEKTVAVLMAHARARFMAQAVDRENEVQAYLKHIRDRHGDHSTGYQA